MSIEVALREEQTEATGARQNFPAIRVASVGKHFTRAGTRALTVLDDVSFSVALGSITAILGPSGCGKSTLLNIIAGLVAADRGSVLIDGQPLQTFVDWGRVGYLFQDDRLLPWRTAIENIALGLEAERIPRTERRDRARQALLSVGLAGFERMYPGELSGGMRSRVALARSLVQEPRILLLDEPFSKLDPALRSQMHLELLGIQAARKMSVVFVTHDIEEAVTLADRVVILQPNPGRVRTEIEIGLARPRLHGNPAMTAQMQALRQLI